MELALSSQHSSHFDQQLPTNFEVSKEHIKQEAVNPIDQIIKKEKLCDDYFNQETCSKTKNFQHIEETKQEVKQEVVDLKPEIVEFSENDNICDFVTSSKIILSEHLGGCQLKKNERKYHCPYCLFKTSFPVYLNRHRENRHPDKEWQCFFENFEKQWLNCKLCSFKTKYPQNMTRHHVCKHTPDSEAVWFECSQCLYKTRVKPHLKQHYNAKHTPNNEIKWFKCDSCVYVSKTKGVFNRHVKNHTSETM